MSQAMKERFILLFYNKKSSIFSEVITVKVAPG